jgi:hypothetical protein
MTMPKKLTVDGQKRLSLRWYPPTRVGEWYTYTSYFVDHGVRDAQDREVGGYATIEVRDDDGCCVRTWVTRNGVRFGAIPRGTTVKTIPEAKKLAEQKMVEQRRRSQKS